MGTAPTARAWLLVEWPLPWPRDAGDVEALQPLAERLAATGTRLQLVVPNADAPTRAVVVHRWSDADGWFDGYERAARDVAPADVVANAAELVDGAPGDAGDGSDGSDVLVCGHGARDRCCGSRGTSLALAALAEGTAVRRTSHTGGHRFAPTAVLLPSGTAWAFLDDDALARIVGRRGPLDDLLPRYRGCGALGSPAVQAVERAAFAEVGWPWLEHRRRGIDLGDGAARVEAIAPDGTHLAWEGSTRPGRLLPIPECGRPVEEAPKHEAEVVVESVRISASRR